MKQFLIIQVILYFGWLSCIAVAQLEISSAITGSASFPRVGLTSLANLAVFITSFVRKRLDLEMGARDFLATMAGPSKFKEEYADKLENENKGEQRKEVPDDVETGACKEEKNKHELIALTPQYIPEASVVMLSNSAGMTNSSIRQFMQYIYNAHNVHSVLLKYDVSTDAKPSDTHCKSGSGGHSCNCIRISDVEGINMPQVLLPSLKCRENGCHRCNRDLLHVEEGGGTLKVEFSSAVSDALDFQFTTPSGNEPICICLPVTDDKWTNLLVRSLKYKDQGDKGAIVAAADALQKYLDKREEDRDEEIKYKTVSLIVIRLVEIFVNLLLTVFFKVDGFSSALAARRAVRSYVVDSKGNGLPANVFLTSGLVVVKSDSVCQVLKFRGNRFFLLIVGCVNLLCAIAWAVVLIAFNGGIGKWYAVPSMAPSIPRVAVIIAAICIGIGMDCFECFKISRNYGDKNPFWKEICNQFSNSGEDKKSWKEIKEERGNALMIWGVIILEILFVVVVAVALGLNKGIGRWVYGSLQLLVWFKWGIGSCILGAYSPEYFPTTTERRWNKAHRFELDYSSAQWVDEGSLVYCSSFFLNAVMVGVMGDWAGIWSTWK